MYNVSLCNLLSLQNIEIVFWLAKSRMSFARLKSLLWQSCTHCQSIHNKHAMFDSHLFDSLGPGSVLGAGVVCKIQMKHTRCIFITERECVLFKSQANFYSKGWFSDAIFCEKAFVFSLNSTDLLDFHSLPSNCCKMSRHFQCNDFQTNIIFNIQWKLIYLSLEF